jgi:hypothetical protein
MALDPHPAVACARLSLIPHYPRSSRGKPAAGSFLSLTVSLTVIMTFILHIMSLMTSDFRRSGIARRYIWFCLLHTRYPLANAQGFSCYVEAYITID